MRSRSWSLLYNLGDHDAALVMSHRCAYLPPASKRRREREKEGGGKKARAYVFVVARCALRLLDETLLGDYNEQVKSLHCALRTLRVIIYNENDIGRPSEQLAKG